MLVTLIEPPLLQLASYLKENKPEVVCRLCEGSGKAEGTDCRFCHTKGYLTFAEDRLWNKKTKGAPIGADHSKMGSTKR